MSAGLSNAYYPRASRTGGATALHFVTSWIGTGLGDLAPEFWPDSQRHFRLYRHPLGNLRHRVRHIISRRFGVMSIGCNLKMMSMNRMTGFTIFLLTACLLPAFSGQHQKEARSSGDPWSAQQLIQPRVLADWLASERPKPVILYVGFPVLYRSVHIPGAQLAGPCSKPEGIALLRSALTGIPNDQDVILYCGCCPFQRCPNIRPAFEELRKAGFFHVHVLDIPTNFDADWVKKNFPIDKRAGS